MQYRGVFRSFVENQEPQLAALEVSAGQGSTAQSAIVLCDVRFGRSRYKLAHFTVYAAVSHAELSVSTTPPNLKTRSRFADHVNTATKTVEVVSRDGRKATSKITGSADLSASVKSFGAKLTAGAKGEKGRSRETEVVTTLTVERAMVRAKGDTHWTIGDFSDSYPLQGKYIGDEPICIIDSDSDIQEIRVNVCVPKANFLVEKVTDNLTGNEIEISRGKKKLIEILTIKAIDKDGDGLVISQGTITKNG